MSDSEFDKYFALRERGAFREAYAVLRQILQNSPRWSKEGDLYVWCAEFELLLNDDIVRARELLRTAAQLGGCDTAYFYCIHGYVLWRAGERQRGIQELEKSVELNPSVKHLTDLARVLSTEGDEGAMRLWQNVLEKDPQNCLAHIYLGLEAARSGDQGKAILMAKRAETLSPSARDFSEIGRLYHQLEEYELAVRSYLSAIRLGAEPKGHRYAGVAACYFALGDVKTGSRYLAWAMRHNPEHEYVKEVYEKSRTLMDNDSKESQE